MPGDTSRIDIGTLRVQWDSHSSMAAICSFWTVTRDQLIRLKHVVPLAPRHDRRLRVKPPREEEPPAEEIAASEASLDLAPMIAARATCESSLWTDEVRASRQVQKSTPFRLRVVECPAALTNMVEGLNRACE